jgi:hypothetical protein
MLDASTTAMAAAMLAAGLSFICSWRPIDGLPRRTSSGVRALGRVGRFEIGEFRRRGTIACITGSVHDREAARA